MSKFKVGDKVRILDDNMSNIGKGELGDIVEIDLNYRCPYKVELYNKIDRNRMLWANVELVEEKDIDVNYILLPDSVTVAFSGQLHTIKVGDHRHGQIVAAIKSDNLEAIPSIVDIAESFSAIEGVELVDGRIKLNGKDIPEVVSDRVLRFKEQGLPFEPLVKFAEKLMNNPSFNSRKMLYKFLEHNGHPITKDGNFIAYRKVRTDFTDCHTGKMDNSLGKVVEMDRNEVDDNPDNTCSSGLHVAAYNYAKSFSSGHLVEVEINPEDVVAVPNDYDGEKMRVCKFKVVKICESKLEEDLYDDGDEYGVDEDDDRQCWNCGSYEEFHSGTCENCGVEW